MFLAFKEVSGIKENPKQPNQTTNKHVLVVAHLIQPKLSIFSC